MKFIVYIITLPVIKGFNNYNSIKKSNYLNNKKKNQSKDYNIHIHIQTLYNVRKKYIVSET